MGIWVRGEQVTRACGECGTLECAALRAANGGDCRASVVAEVQPEPRRARKTAAASKEEK